MDNKVKAGFFILSAAVIIIASMLFYGIAKNSTSASEAHQALCGLKSGYETNLRDSQKYLRNHPNGAPGLGFTAKQVKQQVEQNITRIEIQLKSLRKVKCS